MAHSNIIRRIFEHVSDIIGLNSLETRMKVLAPNCYSFTKRTVPAQTIRFTHNSCLEYKSVSYTMVYTPCLKKHIVT